MRSEQSLRRACLDGRRLEAKGVSLRFGWMMEYVLQAEDFCSGPSRWMLDTGFLLDEVRGMLVYKCRMRLEQLGDLRVHGRSASAKSPQTSTTSLPNVDIRLIFDTDSADGF